MAIFYNTFIKIFSILISFAIIIFVFVIILSFFEKNNNFVLISGNNSSQNTIAIIELSGVIIHQGYELNNFLNAFVISPSVVKKNLEALKEQSPKIIIVSINSPGGTVSASKDLYDIFKKYKKNNNTEIIFHTNEMLTSGGYWVSSAADEIYANYGSIIGSIGVKGPDWFFYDQPNSISTGIFGNSIETKNGIKNFSNKAGKSKDIFNPFREPSDIELIHLQEMVDGIYDDFIRVISKERSIEVKTLINDIGALIYNSEQAVNLHLIDNAMSLDDLITNIAKTRSFEDYRVIQSSIQKITFLTKLLNGNLINQNLHMKIECLNLRSSISVVLNYESTGC